MCAQGESFAAGCLANALGRPAPRLNTSDCQAVKKFRGRKFNHFWKDIVVIRSLCLGTLDDAPLSSTVRLGECCFPVHADLLFPLSALARWWRPRSLLPPRRLPLVLSKRGTPSGLYIICAQPFAPPPAGVVWPCSISRTSWLSYARMAREVPPRKPPGTRLEPGI